MAVHNSTQTLSASGLPVFRANLLNLPELEKISCRFRAKAELHPLQLMGKRIRNAQVLRVPVDDGGVALESSICISRVLAVNLGSLEHGIESAVFLQDEDGSDPYYAELSDLTVLEILG